MFFDQTLKFIIILGCPFIEDPHKSLIGARIEGGAQHFFNNQMNFNLIFTGRGLLGKTESKHMKEEFFKNLQNLAGEDKSQQLEQKITYHLEEDAMDTAQNAIYSFFIILKDQLRQFVKSTNDEPFKFNMKYSVFSNLFHIVRSRYIFLQVTRILRRNGNNKIKPYEIYDDIEEFSSETNQDKKVCFNDFPTTDTELEAAYSRHAYFYELGTTNEEDKVVKIAGGLNPHKNSSVIANVALKVKQITNGLEHEDEHFYGMIGKDDPRMVKGTNYTGLERLNKDYIMNTIIKAIQKFTDTQFKVDKEIAEAYKEMLKHTFEIKALEII